MSICVNWNLSSHLIKWHLAQLCHSRGHVSVTKNYSRLKLYNLLGCHWQGAKWTWFMRLPGFNLVLNPTSNTDLDWRRGPLNIPQPAENPCICSPFHCRQTSDLTRMTFGDRSTLGPSNFIWLLVEPPGSRGESLFFLPGIQSQTFAIQQDSALGMISCYPLRCL